MSDPVGRRTRTAQGRTEDRRRRWRVVTPVAGGTLLFFSLLGAMVAPVVAASPTGGVTVTLQSPASQPSGSAFNYSIDLTCQLSAGAPCGPNSSVTIPLDGTTQPPMGTWAYSVSSAVAGLLPSAAGSPTSSTGTPTPSSARPLTPQADPNGDGGEQLVVPLSDSVFVGGFSGAITLSVTPPNHATANGTAWSVTPTLTGGAIGSVAAPTPATATATASLHPSLSGSASQAPGPGSAVSYTLSPSCDQNGALGDEWSTSGTLVDHLPAAATYHSATNGGVYDPTARTVTWSFPSSAGLPGGCASGAAGAATDAVSVAFPSGTAASAQADQETFTLDGAGSATASAIASASPNIPGSPGASPPSPTTPSPNTPAPAGPPSGGIDISPGHQSHPTGSAQTYFISVSCSGTEIGSCGSSLTVTIPLDTTTTPPMTDPSWSYSATSPTAGLLTSGPTVQGNKLVLGVNGDVLSGGRNRTIALTATPPNDVTPNHTSWSLTPTLSGGTIAPVTSTTTANSVATARPLLSVHKITSDGGSVYLAGHDIPYTIVAACDTGTPGSLYLTDGSLADPLPPGTTFVSASNGGVFNSGTDTVTWNFPTAASTPHGCAAGAAGPNVFKVVVTAPSPAPPPSSQPLINKVTFSGTGPDATNPAGITASTSAQVPVEIVNSPPTGPGSPGYAHIVKTSLAPLAEDVSGNQYVGTYPGNWVTTSSSPTYTVGAAAASFQATVDYSLVGTYETKLFDPLPCLDNANGNRFSSEPFNGAPCAHPAFHPQVIQVRSAGFDSSNGLGAAIASGFLPEAVLNNGTTVPLSPNGSVGPNASSAFFSVPSADIGSVATIVLPPNQSLMNPSLQLTMWGYTDISLAGLNGSVNDLHNIATAVPMLNGHALTPIQDHADVFTVPTPIQLGIAKSFGPTGGGPHGTTVLTMVGGVNLPVVPLTHNVVLTDLLPLGMSWANPSTSGTLTLVEGAGAVIEHVTATAVNLNNFAGSGRDLIRITIPASAFSSTGTWIIKLPTNFLEMTTPTALGLYRNTDQIFLFNLGTTQTNGVCTNPTQSGGGTSNSTFESSDPENLVGDGNQNEDYCQARASLNVLGTGAAFDLTKTVQGNLDSMPKGGLGIGNASPGGSGTYGLDWSNVGSDTLAQPVIYDILPFVGDTGVSEGQSTNPRGSQFQPVFASVGTLPAGVNVLYSQSTNPCRNQVFPDAHNPTCVNDWSTSPPANLASVRALEFTSTGTYPAGSGFSVSVTVDVPPGVVNQVAWNSAATNATDVTNPQDVPVPAEPLKVGLVAPSTPTIVTKTSAATASSFSSLSDQVSITGTGGDAGTLAWKLLGPVAPAGGSCAGLSWTGAPTAAQGTVAVTADGTVTTGPVVVSAVGCYTWTDTLTSTTGFPYQATVPPGEPGETTQVHPYTPSLTTVAAHTIAAGVESVSDTDSVTGIPSGAPANTLTWTLYGPVKPTGATTCPSSAAPYLAVVDRSGTLSVTGNGNETTPAVALGAPGCYSFGADLPATSTSQEAIVSPGTTAETVQESIPTIVTKTSAATIPSFSSASDDITISGMGTGSGTLTWSLVGPVAAGSQGCSGVSWTGAATVKTGTTTITDGSPTAVTAGPVQLMALGCYSWVATLTGSSFPGGVTSAAGTTGEVTQVVPYTPSMATQAALATSTGGAHSVTDTITVSGIPAGAPAATLTWTIYGPVPHTSSGTCPSGAGAYQSATVAGKGTMQVSGDGTVTTPAVQLVTSGCYSYGDSLAATTFGSAAVVAPGEPAETVSFSTTPPPPHTPPGPPFAVTGMTPVLFFVGVLLAATGAVMAFLGRRRQKGRHVRIT
jgi:hypothetical protein